MKIAIDKKYIEEKDFWISICFKFSLKEKVRKRGERKLLKGSGDRGVDVTYMCQLICFLFIFYYWCYI